MPECVVETRLIGNLRAIPELRLKIINCLEAASEGNYLHAHIGANIPGSAYGTLGAGLTCQLTHPTGGEFFNESEANSS